MAKEDVGTTRNYTTTNTVDSRFNWVTVSGTGTLVIDKADGSQLTLTNVPTNMWLPVGNAMRIRTASTATGILVF